MRAAAILLTFASLLQAQQHTVQLTLNPGVSDDQIRSLLASRTEPTIAAIIDTQGRRTLTNPAAAAATTFDIGEIAPTLTALLFQNMVDSGEVALNDPATKHLPPSTAVPMRGKKPATLLDLATHTPTGKYAYSPANITLLAQALASRANTDYATLLQSRVLDPLAMNDTRFDNEHHLRSTADDLLKLLATYLNYSESRLNKDMAALMKARRPIKAEFETSLGWQVRKTNYCIRKGVCLVNQTFDLFTNEGAGIHQAFIGFDPKARTGVVILSSAADGVGLTDLGLYLLSPNSFPLKH